MEKNKINNYIVNYYKNDTTIGNYISNGYLWGVEMKELYSKYYRKNSNILDIGGFVGTVSLVMSEIIDEDKKIYTFEPQYYECLEKNITDNNLENVIIPYKYGLSNVNGFIKSNNIDLEKKGNFGGQHLTTLHDKNIENILVNSNNDNNFIELKRLDDFYFNEIGLIKIDVEGFELLVLKGAVSTLERNNYPPIFIEIWGTECWRNKEDTREYYIKNNNDIKSFLFNLNYKIVWKNNCDYIFVHNNENCLLQKN